MAHAGADVVGAIVGVTAGGLTGAKKTLTREEATEQVQAMCVAAREVNKEVMVLTHGGPFKDPETAAKSEYKGKTYYFCCPGCKEPFDKDPEKYINKK